MRKKERRDFPSLFFCNVLSEEIFFLRFLSCVALSPEESGCIGV